MRRGRAGDQHGACGVQRALLGELQTLRLLCGQACLQREWMVAEGDDLQPCAMTLRYVVHHTKRQPVGDHDGAVRQCGEA